MIRIIYTAMLLFTLSLVGMGQDSNQDNKDLSPGFEKIVNAIKSGQVNDLSAFLAPTVEYEMLGQNNVYSKAQTIQVLKDFFTQNKAKSFSILHQSGKNQIKYLIGSYSTLAGRNYRITCFIKQEGDITLMQQIRIEEESKSIGL